MDFWDVDVDRSCLDADFDDISTLSLCCIASEEEDVAKEEDAPAPAAANIFTDST